MHRRAELCLHARFLDRAFIQGLPLLVDSLRGSSVKIGTIQRRLAWPLRKDDTHKSRSVTIFLPNALPLLSTCGKAVR